VLGPVLYPRQVQSTKKQHHIKSLFSMQFSDDFLFFCHLRWLANTLSC